MAVENTDVCPRLLNTSVKFLMYMKVALKRIQIASNSGTQSNFRQLKRIHLRLLPLNVLWQHTIGKYLSEQGRYFYENRSY